MFLTTHPQDAPAGCDAVSGKKNAAMDKEARRCRSNLSILGSGVIVFTVWDLIKPILLWLFVPQTESVASAEPEIPEAAFLMRLSRETLAAVVIGLLMLWFLTVILRLRIGSAAKAEAAGKRKGGAYVIFAFVLLALQVFGMLLTVVNLFRFGLTSQSFMEAAASLLVEAGSMTVTGELALTATKFRKLRRQQAG